MAKPLYYTFGNHVHWSGQQWMWGYDVLPSSVRDMLELCEATGARGNVNFDGIGYEKMAAEAPEALAELREAVRSGRIEVVGGSYGQPYGLFCGGESNVRQRVYGARAVRRLLGVWPRTFWEEEFDFFPQLPQILAGCGYTGASLFFQWTWHTPTVPEEECGLIQWEGLDGTRLPATPRNRLCLHQWPEDFEGRLESGLMEKLENPALVQWLELIPSPDWMCRSELLLPRLQELRSDPRFELRCRTLGELIEELRAAGPEPPVRRYGLDDVFHGMSLGKNGDNVPRLSRWCEEQLLSAEAVSAVAGLFGRPYPSWDVYPTWELEEAWRELLAGQHHDNHECEGMCGFVGERSLQRSLGLAGHVWQRTLDHLARRARAPDGHVLVFNPLGWARDVVHDQGIARDVPAFGWRVVDPDVEEPLPYGEASIREEEDAVWLVREDLEVRVDRERGVVTQLRSRELPEGVLSADRPLGELSMTRQGQIERFEAVSFEVERDGDFAQLATVREGRAGSLLRVTYDLSPLHRALWIRVQAENLTRPDGGMHAGLQTAIEPVLPILRLLHDHPFGSSEIAALRDHQRKYPTGDWMTSPQVFETVRRPFTAWSFVDLLLGGGEPDRGLLVVHDGAQGFFRTDDGVRQLLNMYDPWDEDHFGDFFVADLWVLPHGPLTGAERARLAAECQHSAALFRVGAITGDGEGGNGPPATFGGPWIDAPGVVPTSFHRESRRSAGHPSDGFASKVRDPFVLRLVERNGEPADFELRVPGRVAAAARTDLLGRVQERLSPESAPAPWGPDDLAWSRLRLRMRPHEIATVMLDLEMGRQIPRNLDEHRHVWASVHRRGEGGTTSAPT